MSTRTLRFWLITQITSHIELLRALLAGVAGLITDVGTIVLLTEVFHAPYLASSFVAFIVGLSTSYLLSIYWVFNQRKLKGAQSEFWFFCIIGIIGLALNELLIWLLTEKCSLHYLASKGFAVIVVFFWNYGVRKRLLF